MASKVPDLPPRPATLSDVRRAAADLSDTAGVIERAVDERAVVLRLPSMLARWNAFRTAVREAGEAAAGAPLGTLRAPQPGAQETTLEYWEASLRSITMRASAAGFNVTYDVWLARVAGQGGDDG